MNKINYMELAKSIFLSVIMLCVLFGVALYIISSIDIDSLCESLCEYHKGKIVFYECQNPILFNNMTICSELKTGLFCEYDNKSISCRELLDEINSSI